jgi:hypothetical protein
MLGLEIRINGELMCTAGGADLGVLSAVVTVAAGLAPLTGQPGWDVLLPKADVSGLTKGPDPRQAVEWLQHQLRVGDELTVRIVDQATFDPPKTRQLVTGLG